MDKPLKLTGGRGGKRKAHYEQVRRACDAGPKPTKLLDPEAKTVNVFHPVV